MNQIDDEPRMVYDDDKIHPGYHCGVFGDFKYNGRDRIYMQYTGLKDKNGKDIYEGDIIEDDVASAGKRTREVTINGIGIEPFLSCCFYAKDYQVWSHFTNPEKTIVIGNIYENSDLLK